MKYYEIATLKTVIFGTGKAAPAIEAWVKEAVAGRLLGAFAADIGALNEIYVLRGFDSLDTMEAQLEKYTNSPGRKALADLPPSHHAKMEIRDVEYVFDPTPASVLA